MMDLVKSFLTFVFVTIVTIVFFHFWIDRDQYKWQSQYNMKQDVLKDYIKNSSKYVFLGYDAFESLLKCNSKDSTDLINTWQNQGYDDFTISEMNLKRWFVVNKKNDTILSHLVNYDMKNEKDKFYELFIVLSRKVKSEKIYLYSDSSRKAYWKTYKESYYIPEEKRFDSINNIIINLAKTKLERLD